MQKIISVDELRKACSKEDPEEFFIDLGGVHSSKSIMLTEDGHFDVVNEVDDTQQILTSDTLFTQSNIGDAIINGAFYAF